MSLAINPLGQDIPPEPERPKVYANTYKHSIVESSCTPETSLLSMVDGTPRLGEVYRQFLGASEEPAQFSPDNAPTYQSYTRIKKVIYKQEGPGAFSFDANTGESTDIVNMWCSYDLVPVRYDVIIFDIGEGRAGLFQISEQPEIRNNTANKVYYLTVQYLGVLTADVYEKLNSRVVQELVYSKDSVLSGGVAIVEPATFDYAEQLFNWRRTIGSYLMSTFYWNPERTIAWEDSNGNKIYDQYLVKFIDAVMEPDLRIGYPPINQFSTQYGGREYGSYGTINVWELLLRGDWNLLPLCKENAAVIIGTDRLINTRMYGNLRSSKFTWFVATDPERYQQMKMYFNVDGFPILSASPQSNITYLFSAGFYAGVPEGEFESLVTDILKNQLVDRKRLLAFCDTYFSLAPWQQLYYGAILILLIQISRKIGPSL